MRKKDITEKLTFDGNPALVIKGEVLEVNADAPTMLKIMGIMGEGAPGAGEILEAYELLFPEETKQTIEGMKLSFSDLTTVIREGIKLVAGEENGQGE